ncbi:DUF726-domain-containing protein [Xylona heveae TC161]|uniref:DUF726-domain-containing protein n=1 Tax=Xylona heveae (strain CBS 132557 / TC161) TaxID=1328760 RepID=A0A165A2L5_XYLHT|nr:DUF726-domain-containing protein [Xylona heveae TC161]KZF19867.1 DUF726-domain-containing protein [Xylona heveae TC161]
MPWSSKEDTQESQGDDQSLRTVLDAHQCSDLTLLIASVTETMRKRISHTFTVQDEPHNTDTDSSNNPDDAADQLRKRQEQQEQQARELAKPEVQELKIAALEAFDEWRDSVLRRVGEVVNSPQQAQQQKHEAKPGHVDESTGQTKEVRENAPTETVSAALLELFPPISTPLANLPEETRILILHSMLLLLLSLEQYTADSRILLLYLTSSLRLPINILAEDETKVAQGLLKAAKEMSGDEETAKKAEENKISRKWKVGLASVAGAALIGVTGGLAAPLVAAGIGSVMGGLGLGATAAAGYLGTLAGSSVVVGSLFGAYGGRMTGQMMDNYAKEVSDFAFVPNPAASASEDHRLRITIGISGWLTSQDEITRPWRVLGHGSEIFALRWELEALLSLGNALTAMVKSAAWGYAKSEIIKRTIFASLTAALWPLGLLKISRVVDNPFSIARTRGDKAGEVLADALINRAQGQRPVTLIGYSLGARVIYSCLQHLAARRAFGLVESVVLMGAPTPSDSSDWRNVRAVVAGRVVNVYSERDYILAFLYRTSSVQYGIAGLQAIAGVPGVENVNVSELVSGHLKYRYLVGKILEKIGFEDVIGENVARQERELQVVEKQFEREKESQQAEAEAGAGGEGEEDADKEAERLQKEVDEKMRITE